MKFKDMPYSRVNIDMVTKELLALTEHIKNAKSAEEQFDIHREYYKLCDDVQTNIQIATIRHDIDTTDKFYDTEQNHNDEIEPILENASVAYCRALYESPFRAELEEKIGKVAFKNMELRFKGVDEKIIPLMQKENNLSTEYDKLIAGAAIDWHGETLNISLLRKYLTDPNREVRREAWEKMSNYFSGVSDELDRIYDELVKNRTMQGKEMGYENYLELGYARMNRNSYGRDEIEKLRNQVKKYIVPLATKLHEKRRASLGIDKLSYIDNDMFFKDGNPAPVGTPEEILSNGLEMYSQLSSDTREFMKFMMDNELFDVLGRKTKKAGGYMTYIPNYNSPYVFANFNGTNGDVDVITHECGHAFQGYLSGKDPIREHSDITMETAEIHSMSMEFFTEPWMEMFFGDKADDYRSSHAEDALIFIPYGCMVDEFQHRCYEYPDMTPEERNKVWLDLERQYRPHIDYEDNAYFGSGAFWQKQQHIYDYPLYYIDYVLAQLCAFQYKIWMTKNFSEAWDSYLKLCKLSAKDFYPAMLKEVGLKVPYEDGTIEWIADELGKIWS